MQNALNYGSRKERFKKTNQNIEKFSPQILIYIDLIPDARDIFYEFRINFAPDPVYKISNSIQRSEFFIPDI